MNLVKILLTIMLSLTSVFAYARIYSFDATGLKVDAGSITTDAGWTQVVSTYVNPLVNNWVLFDVLRVERLEGANQDQVEVFRTWYGPGGWKVSTHAEIAAALESGSIIILASTTTGGGTNDCLLPVPDCEQESEPLMIDLGQDGIHLGQAGRGIYYDFAGDGVLRPVQWVAEYGNDAFLTLDKNNNGDIDNGSELFGRGFLFSGQRANNGFAELAQYDSLALGGNQDGVISPLDSIWPELRLWLDTDANGKSHRSELMTLDTFGISELSLSAKENGRRDPAGNYLRFWAWASDGRGNAHSKFKMVDVYFKSLGSAIEVIN